MSHDILDLYPYEKNLFANETNEQSFIPYQIFLHHVDTLNSKYIASYLSDQIKGIKAEAGGEDEEEAVIEEDEAAGTNVAAGEKYQIIGTLKEEFHKPTEDILYVIKESDEMYNQKILESGYVIFDASRNLDVIPAALNALDVIQKEFERIKEVGPKTYAQTPEIRVFIFISSVLTWALTKPIDPEDPDLAFTEADYKKRKCHPNYKALIDCEREVVAVGKKYKDKLKTYVICSGIIYGMEEEDLLYLFQIAWENETMPLFKPGNYYIPLIHIKDLIKVIHGICETAPKKKYILAVEQTPCTLKSIVKTLSKLMGNRKINEIEKEEAFITNNLTEKQIT